MVFLIGEIIIKLKKKAIRAITKTHKYAHTDALFKLCNVLKLEDIVIIQELKFFYNFENGMLPKYFYLECFLIKYEGSKYNTRQNLQLKPYISRLCLKSLKYNIPNTVNCCKTNIISKVQTHSMDGFNSYFKKMTIQSYQVQCTIVNCYSCYISQQQSLD